MNNRIILIGLGFLLLAGCVSQSRIYHWGNYTDSLYEYTKEPSEKTRIAHSAELQEIIADARGSQKKVPPGIHFELAVLQAEAGNTELAKSNFAKERELFPESETYVLLALKEMESN